MRKLTATLCLTIAVLFSSPSFSGWTKVAEDSQRKTFYVDLEKIKKKGKYIYFWRWLDHRFQPDKDGTLSSKAFFRGDCNLFRANYMSLSKYKKPMGRGYGKVFNLPSSAEKKWFYATPNTPNERVLQAVCAKNR